MKKQILLLGLALFGTLIISAQTDNDALSTSPFKFGVTGGLLNNNTDFDISVIGFDLTSIDAFNETGFYIGAFADFALSNKLHLQPELTYGKAGDLEFVFLPIMAKFYVANKFSIHAGPQINFSTNISDIKKNIRDAADILGIEGDVDDFIKTTGFDLGFGAAYDITNNLFVQARYTFGLTDRYDGPLSGSLDVKSRNLFVGIGYSF